MDFPSVPAVPRTRTRSPAFKSDREIGVASFRLVCPGFNCRNLVVSETVQVVSAPASVFKVMDCPEMAVIVPRDREAAALCVVEFSWPFACEQKVAKNRNNPTNAVLKMRFIHNSLSETFV